MKGFMHAGRDFETSCSNKKTAHKAIKVAGVSLHVVQSDKL